MASARHGRAGAGRPAGRDPAPRPGGPSRSAPAARTGVERATAGHVPDSAPDPHVIRVDDRYYAYATNGTEFGRGDFHNIQRYESTNLQGWVRTAVPDALPVRPAWAAQTGGWMWAPTVFPIATGQYVMFFVARSAANGRQCIGRAVADEPDDVFQPTGGGPVVCQSGQGGSIDPYHFQDPTDGARYLYWKNDGNACDPDCPVRLWGRRLDDDGHLVAQPAAALVTHDRAWEVPLIENPAMTHSAVGSPFRLFYSANWYTTSQYATGYADCGAPLGPCQKVTTASPWHDSTPYARGPGGAAFFEDFEGKNWMAHHGYRPGFIGAQHARFLFVDKVDFHHRPVLNSAFPFAFHVNAPHPFVDVAPNHWAAGGIAWLATDTAPFPGAATTTVAAGFGLDPDEIFRPRRSMTRATLLNWVWKLEGHPGETPPPTHPPNPFTDSMPWIQLPLDWVGAEGLMTGYPDNASPPACGAPGPGPVFGPSCPISRGAYVRLLWRLVGSPTDYPDPGFSDLSPTSWAFDAVSWAVGEGHMTGYGDGTFRVGAAIRRDQAANALVSQYVP